MTGLFQKWLRPMSPEEKALRQEVRAVAAAIVRQIEDFYALHEGHHLSPRIPFDSIVSQEIECYTCNEKFLFRPDDGWKRTWMTKDRPWWMKRTGAVNLTMLGALVLFILWGTFCQPVGRDGRLQVRSTARSRSIGSDRHGRCRMVVPGKCHRRSHLDLGVHLRRGCGRSRGGAWPSTSASICWRRSFI